MTTTIRAQKAMAQSTGMLAHQLAAERERIERELDALSKGLPDGAADVVRRANEILESHGQKLSELRRAKDELDAQWSITERQQAEQQAVARQEHYAGLVAKLRAAEDERCAAVARIEEHARELANAIGEAFAAADQVRRAASDLSAMGRKRPNFPSLGQPDFANRIGGRIAGLMSSTLSALYRAKLGPISWGATASFYATADNTDWAARERRHFKLDVEQAIEMGARDAD